MKSLEMMGGPNFSGQLPWNFSGFAMRRESLQMIPEQQQRSQRVFSEWIDQAAYVDARRLRIAVRYQLVRSTR